MTKQSDRYKKALDIAISHLEEIEGGYSEDTCAEQDAREALKKINQALQDGDKYDV